MSTPSCSVLIVSCDRYRDLWTPFFRLFWQCWPDCPFPVYLGTNFAPFSEPKVQTIAAGTDESWSKSLRFFLNSLDTEYVLLLLEDFFLDGPLSTAAFIENLRTLDALHGTVLRLCPLPPPDIRLEDKRGIGILHRLAPFRVSAQPAIWRRLDLIAILRDGESAWEFEHRGTVRSQANPEGYFGTYQANITYRHVVEQGQWFWSAAKYYSKKSVGCDFLARPIMGPFTAFRKTVITAIRQACSWVLALPLRSRVPASAVARTSSLRLALLTNFIPPYQKPVLEALSRRYPALRILLSTPMESNRSWKAEWEGLDVVVQKTFSFAGRWRHARGFSEALTVHLPLDTLQQLRRHRAALAISNELGARTAGAALYRKLTPHFRLIAWVEAADASERSRGVARRVLRRLLIRQIDAFLAVGTTSEEYLQSLGIPKTKIFKAVYATDVARFSREELLRQPGTERRLLYVGQLVERKGVLPFLKVLSGWAEDHPGEFVEFTIAGEGPLRGDLEKLTLPANLKTLFPGACRYEDLPAVYGQAGIFVLPSFADTWAVVVNEAMAAGLPVLGSLYAQAVRELVQDGREGWTFEPDRAEQMYGAIDRMMQTSLVELDRMRVSAQRRALELTPEAAAEFIDAAIVACFRNQK